MLDHCYVFFSAPQSVHRPAPRSSISFIYARIIRNTGNSMYSKLKKVIYSTIEIKKLLPRKKTAETDKRALVQMQTARAAARVQRRPRLDFRADWALVFAPFLAAGFGGAAREAPFLVACFFAGGAGDFSGLDRLDRPFGAFLGT